jgi:hypothetical protein
MTTIYIDLETCPAQNPRVRDEIAATIEPPGNISKAETIAAWIADKKPAAVEEAWRKTSFDGALGHICVVGIAVDDEEPWALYSNEWCSDEATILRKTFSLIDSVCARQPNVRPVFVGHNLVEFDLRFLFQRCVVLGVKPSRHIPFAAKPWDDSVYDTMARWGARAGGSLDKITRALGLAGKGDIDGSKVWDYVRDGRISEVAAYCKNDVALTRALFKRMTFAEAA